jgi:hypothetical protein
MCALQIADSSCVLGRPNLDQQARFLLIPETHQNLPLKRYSAFDATGWSECTDTEEICRFCEEQRGIGDQKKGIGRCVFCNSHAFLYQLPDSISFFSVVNIDYKKQNTRVRHTGSTPDMGCYITEKACKCRRRSWKNQYISSIGASRNRGDFRGTGKFGFDVAADGLG